MPTYRFFAVVLFIFCIAGYSHSQNQLQAQISPTRASKLDRYLEKKMDKMDIPGMQVAFIVNGDYIWQGNYGIRKYGDVQKVDQNTLFMIASCSKPVTAFGVLKLVDQGKIELDDPVNSHLPFKVVNPRFSEDQITIRMLLSHTSSLKDNWPVLTPLYTTETGGGDSPIPLQEFLKNYLLEGGKYYDLEENFMEGELGSEFRYSNVGYALLGHLIECVSGKSFNEFMRHEIFGPLGMHNSYWFLADIPHENIASPHDLPTKKNGLTEPRIFDHYGYPDYPDGQIRTTVSDYSKFLNVILNEGKINGSQFVQKTIIDEFLRIQFPEVNKHQAIAWNYNEFDSFIYYLLMPRLPSHTGVDPGVATTVSFDPKRKTGVVIFANALPNTFIDQKRFYQEMMKRLFKEADKL